MVQASFLKRSSFCVAVLWAATCPLAAWGLNPSLAVAQYGHRAWRTVDGVGLGTITAIGQTTDGYLWLGTPTGLLRFDGVHSSPTAPEPGNALDGGVRALHGARDGTLWIATRHGLFSLKSGIFKPEPAMGGMVVNAIDEDADGTIRAAGATNGKGTLCIIGQHTDECRDEQGRYGPEILALHRDSTQSLWIIGVDRAWKTGGDHAVSFALPGYEDALRSVTDTADGALLVGLRGKVARISGVAVDVLALPGWTTDLAFDKALRTQDGSLWLGASDSGLIHLHEGRLDTFAASDGLSGDKILDLFEDREGNVWVSTSRGLDQFRSTAASTQSGVNGLKGRCRAVLSTREGTLWASTTTGVYQRLSSGAWELRRSWLAGVGSLYEDQYRRVWVLSRSGVQYFDGRAFVDASGIPPGAIDAMIDDAQGNLWLAHRELGLLRIRRQDQLKLVAEPVWRPSARVSALATDPLDQSVWVGQWSGTLEKVHNGEVIERFELPTDSASSRGAPGINHIRVESDGSVWVSTSAGLVRIAHGHFARLGFEAGARCERLLWSFTDKKSLWMIGSCGLLRVARADADEWGAAADGGRGSQVNAHLLDSWDGITPVSSGLSYATYNPTAAITPKMATAADGTLWIVGGDSLVTVDPDWVPSAEPSPPVYIERLVSDGTNYPLRAGLRLPPLQHDLEIDYTAIRFASPQRLQFRYKLEGRDAECQDVGNRRQAFYTDLPPGRYSFRVSASSKGGHWTEDPAVQEFEIGPAFVQTRIFQTICCVAGAVLLAALMRWRARQLTRLERTRLEGMMTERERIARELHDTLLQSNQALILQAQAAMTEMPQDSPGVAQLQKTLDRAEEVVVEARDRVFDLRHGGHQPDDLPLAIEGLGVDSARGSTSFNARVVGQRKGLKPRAAEEAWSIAREAVRNAFKHADANVVEVLLTYGADALYLSVRDDGQGFSVPLGKSRGTLSGHWGIPGMRERAELLGASFEVTSTHRAGTEIKLAIPAKAAYATK